MMAIEVRFAWWARPLLYAYAIAQALRLRRVDPEQVARMLARAVRIAPG